MPDIAIVSCTIYGFAHAQQHPVVLAHVHYLCGEPLWDIHQHPAFLCYSLLKDRMNDEVM